MESVEEKRIGKYKIEIVQDENADSPDFWENEDAFVVYDHRDFYVKRKGFEPRDIFDNKNLGYKLYKGYYVFILYAYIHSGVVLSVESHNFPDARWDVSTTGFVLVKREKGMYNREKALKLAEAVTHEWNQYLSGEVYGYKITSEDDDFDDVIDSCWGFYGDPEYCMTEATEIVEYLVEKDKHGQLELDLK
jgi:hypothetical protein